MQGSIEDWTVESALMGDVYSNSLRNITTTASADGNSGLSMSGWSALNLPCVVPSSPQFDTPGPWHIHPMFLAYATFILEGLLLTRGWVVQERVLAPRTFHLAPERYSGSAGITKPVKPIQKVYHMQCTPLKAVWWLPTPCRKQLELEMEAQTPH
jgi:hypothetical protein